MARWQPFDVVGGAYSDDTRPWSVQDTVNYLVVNAERPGGRSSKMLRGVPGLVTFSADMPESPVRGLYVAEGRLFAVVGTTLYSIGTDGAATSLGTIPGVGRCVFAHNQVTNGNQVVIGNGQSGYVYDTVAGTLVQITDEAFPGLRSVDFADQQIIGVEPFGRYWFQSDLAGALSYNSLDRNEAENAPDRIQQAIVTGADVLVLGERTLQFFYNTGEDTGTWSNRSGAEQDIGAASPWTACRLDNTVYWLGNDGSVYRLNGYVPQRISTHALEQAISRSTLSDAYAFTFEDRGHKCYLLTFPDGRTWCFDAATQEWTRRESYGFDRWRVSALVKWGRHWIAGDFINGRLYQLDWAVQQEAGEPLERRRITGVLHDHQNRMIVNALELVFDTGMDEDSPPLPSPVGTWPTITGDVPGGLVGSTGSGSYVVSGGLAPYVVTVSSGTIPPGLTINSDGTYSYTYTTEGSYSWVAQATDANGNTATVNDSAVIAQPMAYVANQNGGTVSVIDLGALSVVATITGQNGPETVLIAQPFGVGYVFSSDVAVGGGIQKINLGASTFAGLVAGSDGFAHNNTFAVSPDYSMMAASNYLGSTIRMLDAGTGTLAGSVSVTNPGGMAFSPTGSLLYVTTSNTSPGRVYEVSVATLAITGRNYALGNDGRAVVASLDGSKVYATSQYGGGVHVIATSTFAGALLTTFAADVNGHSLLLSRDGTRLYCGGQDAVQSVAIINTTTDAVTATVALGIAANRMIESLDGAKLLVGSSASPSLKIVDVVGASVAATVTLTGNARGLAITPDGSKVLITNSNNKVDVINVATNSLQTTIDVGLDPRGIGVGY